MSPDPIPPFILAKKSVEAGDYESARALFPKLDAVQRWLIEQLIKDALSR